MTFVQTLKWALSAAVYLAMVGLCVFHFDYAGVGGLAGSALGFLWRVWAPGQETISERLGNGYVGLLIGVCIGFGLGAIAEYALPIIQSWR